MIIKCECNKREYHELIKQLKDEKMAYHATIQTSMDETYDESLTDPFTIETMKTTTYHVVFWYDGKLI